MFYKLVFGFIIFTNILWATKYSSSEIEEWKNVGIKEVFIGSWKDAGYTSQEAKQWIDIGISRLYTVNQWKKVGFNTPEDTQKWTNVGVTEVETLKDWQRAGINTPKEVNQWRMIGIKDAYHTYPWKNANVKDPQEVKGWMDLQIEATYVSRLKKQGINTPAKFKEQQKEQQTELQHWKNIGVHERMISSWKSWKYNTPEEAKEWVDAGIENPSDLSYIKEANIKTSAEAKEWLEVSSPRDIKYWLNLGITTADEVKDWQEIGLEDSYSVEYWINAGAKTPKEVKDWNNVNVRTAKNLVELKKKGINSPKQLKKILEDEEATTKEWDDAGIPDYYISSWIDIGVTSAKNASNWKKNGFILAGNAKDWIEAGVTNPKNAKTYQDAGVSYIDFQNKNNLSLQEIKNWNDIGVVKVVKWKELGIETPEKVKPWIKMVGDDPDYVKKIITMGFKTPLQYQPYQNMNLENAVKLYEWNIKPNKLIESMSYGNEIFGKKLYFENKKMFVQAYKILQNHCSEIIKDKWFAGIDMSMNSNQCYTFVGTMVQRLDEKSLFGKVTNKGLVSGTGKRYIYVEDFQGSWLENETKIGIIKGNGSFSYDSNSGKRVVPKGTVVFFQ